MKEDFLAIVASNEPEATIANHLLDLATTFGSAGGGARTTAGGGRSLTPPSTPSATRCSEPIRRDEFISEEIEYDGEILKPLLFRREQNLTPLRFDDAVAKPGILVRHKESGFNFIECQHDASPVP
jgi:hypothetical protein